MKTETRWACGIGLALVLLLGWGGVGFGQPDTVWTRTFGLSLAEDWCLRLIPTLDRGYVLGGYTVDNEAGRDFLLVKLNSEFEQEWIRSYEWHNRHFMRSVTQGPDGGFVMVGSSDLGNEENRDYAWIAKTDATGDLMWAGPYGGGGGSFGDVLTDSEGRIIAAGYIGRQGTCMIQVDPNGDSLWTQEYGGSVIRRMTPTHDGGYIMAGWADVIEGGRQGYLVKTDSSGQIEWDQYYGGASLEVFGSVVPTEDGGYVGAGTSTELGNIDLYVVKINSEGDENWSHIYPNNGSGYLNDLIILPDGGFLALGNRSGGFRSYAAYRLDSNGEFLWRLDYGEHPGMYEFDAALVLDDGSYLIAGTGRITQDNAQREFVLIRTEPDPLLANDVVLLDPSFPSSSSLSSPFPSPFNSSITIPYTLARPGVVRIALFDLAGREVAVLTDRNVYPPGRYQVRWDGAGFPAGEYLLRMSVGKEVVGRKVVLVK